MTFLVNKVTLMVRHLSIIPVILHIRAKIKNAHYCLYLRLLTEYKKMKPGIVAILLAFCCWTSQKNLLQNFDREIFYNALASDNLNSVNAQLEAVRHCSLSEKNAFEGTLLMKKAAIVSTPREKLGLFKSGHIKLEAAINADKQNAEFRFLRLLIQENAPKFLGYHSNMNEDAEVIRNSYSSLADVVQQAVKDYSRKSKVLHDKDF
jgi:hypothetical protein